MLDLPALEELEVQGKNVLVRGDFDVDDANNPRADSIREIIRYLQSRNAAKIKVIGHTETNFDLASELGSEFPGVEFDSGLRNDPGEKENSMEFALKLAEGWNMYVNESFATSHREHASIVSLPHVIKSQGGDAYVGLRFEAEISHLGRVIKDPKRPVIMVISGVKEDKLSFVESFSKFADKILIGGKLPDLIDRGIVDLQFSNYNTEKIIVAGLVQDKEDITVHSMEIFEEEIKKAGTIVVSGTLGKYEDEGHRQGTERIFKAVVANKNAFKVTGGGNTESAIDILGLVGRFDWVSVGGGAMLEFLAKGTLPGIEALR